MWNDRLVTLKILKHARVCRVPDCCNAHVQAPKFMWVDDSHMSSDWLLSHLPSLELVLEDSTHVMRRYFRSLHPRHIHIGIQILDFSPQTAKILNPETEVAKADGPSTVHCIRLPLYEHEVVEQFLVISFWIWYAASPRSW